MLTMDAQFIIWEDGVILGHVLDVHFNHPERHADIKAAFDRFFASLISP